MAVPIRLAVATVTCEGCLLSSMPVAVAAPLICPSLAIAHCTRVVPQCSASTAPTASGQVKLREKQAFFVAPQPDAGQRGRRESQIRDSGLSPNSDNAQLHARIRHGARKSYFTHLQASPVFQEICHAL